MDIDKMLMTAPAPAPDMLDRAQAAASDSADKKMRFARDFEALLLNRLCSEMKNTIGNWGLEKSSGTDQIDGIFYMMLSRAVADQGGMGLWKDIYRCINEPDPTADSTPIRPAGETNDR